MTDNIIIETEQNEEGIFVPIKTTQIKPEVKPVLQKVRTKSNKQKQQKLSPELKQFLHGVNTAVDFIDFFYKKI